MRRHGAGDPKEGQIKLAISTQDDPKRRDLPPRSHRYHFADYAPDVSFPELIKTAGARGRKQ